MKKNLLLPLFAVASIMASWPATSTQISNVPLSALGVTGAVKPNVMLMLDNSGSMDWDFVGDYVNDNFCKRDPAGAFTGYCCASDNTSSSGRGSTSCWTGAAPFGSWRGHPPFLANAFNGVAYNPAIWYKPPLKATAPANSTNPSDYYGAGNITSFTAVKNDGYNIQNTGTINLLTGYPDSAWCSDTALTDCLRNDNYLLPGKVNGVTYQYFKATTGNGTGRTATGPATAPVLGSTQEFGPHYYAIRPGEYCTDPFLRTCRAQAAEDSTYRYPAYVRWCSDAQLRTCQGTRTDTYRYPRYPGRVVSAIATVTVTGSGSRSVTNITVDGQRIMSGATAGSTTTNTVATRIRDNINACTAAVTGQCQVAGYSATVSGSVVTIYAPLNVTNITSTPAVTANFTPTVTPFSGENGAVPGRFVRVDIVPSKTSYGNPYRSDGKKEPCSLTGEGRCDCSGTDYCTYQEEMTNFANWWSYYHSRMQMMKTAVGHAFNSLANPERYQVGITKLSDVGYGGAIDAGGRGMFPKVFSGTDRQAWYDKLYSTNASSSTPLRTALDNIGKMYANQSPYNYTGNARVVQYACQQNFTILTTDGYWNQTYSGSVQNNDNTANASRFCTRSIGCVDPTSPSQQASLADVALYWYNGGSNTGTVSLRPDLEPDVSQPGLVPATGRDPNSHLHMTTYTLGLGMSGNITYEKDYATAPLPGGDFSKIVNGTLDWPQAVNDSASAVDDLWHAAINGHGKYFSARTPNEVVRGLKDALADMKTKIGAGAASAAPANLTEADRTQYSAIYYTSKWFGRVTAEKLDSNTGEATGEPLKWDSGLTLGKKVDAASDERNIYMYSSAGNRKDFRYSAMTSAEKGWFSNKGSTMSQYTDLTVAADRALVDSGENLVNWLRGQHQYADDRIFRSFTLYGLFFSNPQNTTYDKNTNPYLILGDVVSSKPAYVRSPTRAYPDDYVEGFKLPNANRAPRIYVAANDGMLHAFDAETGDESWAYVPRISMPKLHKLANRDYGSNHIYTVDGSPAVGDVKIGGSWRTVLVAGLNAGGRGYYALDVTNPSDPKPLWELCSDSSICAKNDQDIGLTFGTPKIGKWNGRWVALVTSGYNNTPGTDYAGSAGDGKGYLYVVDIADGTILNKVGTSVGTTATPSGLAKFTAITKSPQTDPVITYAYGGDTLGNLWRFDLTTASPTVAQLATVGATKPITTEPMVTGCATLAGDVQRVVAFGTGRLLGDGDVADTSTQSFYVIKDTDSPNIIGALNGNVSMVKQTMSGSTTVTITNDGVNWQDPAVNGWYSDFIHTGERVNVDPIVFRGLGVVGTNLPTTSTDNCSIGGSSYLYAFNICGSASGLPPGTVGEVFFTGEQIAGFNIVATSLGKGVVQGTGTGASKKKKDLDDLAAVKAKKTGWRTMRNR